MLKLKWNTWLVFGILIIGIGIGGAYSTGQITDNRSYEFEDVENVLFGNVSFWNETGTLTFDTNRTEYDVMRAMVFIMIIFIGVIFMMTGFNRSVRLAKKKEEVKNTAESIGLLSSEEVKEKIKEIRNGKKEEEK